MVAGPPTGGRAEHGRQRQMRLHLVRTLPPPPTRKRSGRSKSPPSTRLHLARAKRGASGISLAQRAKSMGCASSARVAPLATVRGSDDPARCMNVCLVGLDGAGKTTLQSLLRGRELRVAGANSGPLRSGDALATLPPQLLDMGARGPYRRTG